MLEGRRAGHGVADALAFVQDGPEVSRATHAWRLGVIRMVAAWLRVNDPPAAEAIPPGLIRGGYQRVTSYQDRPFLLRHRLEPRSRCDGCPRCSVLGTPWILPRFA